VFGQHGDLRKVDPRDAVLFGECAQDVDLVDHALLGEVGGERLRVQVGGAFLRAQRRVELLLGDELLL